MFSKQNNGIIGRNLEYIAQRRNCESTQEIAYYCKYNNIDNDFIVRAMIIKELTNCAEQTMTLPGFNLNEIKDFINCIAIT